MQLLIDVYGRPAPQGSKKSVGNNRFIEASKYLPAWRKAVKEAAIAAVADSGWETLQGAVRLECVFYLERPATIKLSARPLPIKPPDISKLLRAVEDSLTDAGVWGDDSQVITAKATKFYADDRAPGVIATISPL